MREIAKGLIERRLNEEAIDANTSINELIDMSDRQLAKLNELNTSLGTNSVVKADITKAINSVTDMKRILEGIRTNLGTEVPNEEKNT